MTVILASKILMFTVLQIVSINYYKSFYHNSISSVKPLVYNWKKMRSFLVCRKKQLQYYKLRIGQQKKKKNALLRLSNSVKKKSLLCTHRHVKQTILKKVQRNKLLQMIINDHRWYIDFTHNDDFKS